MTVPLFDLISRNLAVPDSDRIVSHRSFRKRKVSEKGLRMRKCASEAADLMIMKGVNKPEACRMVCANTDLNWRSLYTNWDVYCEVDDGL